MWATYTTQIDLGHPVEMSFDRWVDASVPPAGHATLNINGKTVYQYAWENQNEETGHSVVGVGYFVDSVTGNWLICQDGWGIDALGNVVTPQYVAVPEVYARWWENDYVTAIPEPSTIILLVAGAVSALIYGWRRRRTA